MSLYFIIIFIMEQELNFVKCQKCLNKVEEKKFLIHDKQCKGEMAQSKLKSKIKIQNSRMKRTIQKQNKKQEVVQEEIIEQTFPCSLCAYRMKITELDKHPQECPGKLNQCQYCNVCYPYSLIQQHYMVCPARNLRPPRMYERRPRQIQLIEQDYQEEEQNMRPIRNIVNLMRIASRRNRSNLQQDQEDHGMRRSIELGNLIRLLLMREQLQVNNGLDKNELNQLQKIKYRKTEEDDLCTICYCNFEDKQEIIKLKCKHLYHNQCIQKWLSENPLCPVCKTNIKNEE